MVQFQMYKVVRARRKRGHPRVHVVTREIHPWGEVGRYLIMCPYGGFPLSQLLLLVHRKINVQANARSALVPENLERTIP